MKVDLWSLKLITNARKRYQHPLNLFCKIMMTEKRKKERKKYRTCAKIVFS
jgi:hypothetical protein